MVPFKETMIHGRVVFSIACHSLVGFGFGFGGTRSDLGSLAGRGPERDRDGTGQGWDEYGTRTGHGRDGLDGRDWTDGTDGTGRDGTWTGRTNKQVFKKGAVRIINSLKGGLSRPPGLHRLPGHGLGHLRVGGLQFRHRCDEAGRRAPAPPWRQVGLPRHHGWRPRPRSALCEDATIPSVLTLLQAFERT